MGNPRKSTKFIVGKFEWGPHGSQQACGTNRKLMTCRMTATAAKIAAWRIPPTFANISALEQVRGRPRKHAAADPSDQPYDNRVADQNKSGIWSVRVFITRD
jgi:hypothetical protein